MKSVPIESNLQCSPAHAPRIRALKEPQARRAGATHADRIERASLPAHAPRILASIVPHMSNPLAWGRVSGPFPPYLSLLGGYRSRRAEARAVRFPFLFSLWLLYLSYLPTSDAFFSHSSTVFGPVDMTADGHRVHSIAFTNRFPLQCCTPSLAHATWPSLKLHFHSET